MKYTKNLREDSKISCKVLINFIENTNDKKKIKVFLCDFVDKYKDLTFGGRLYYTSQLLQTLSTNETKPILNEIVKLNKERGIDEESFDLKDKDKPRADIAIITIKKPELLAVKIALGIDLENKLGDWEYRGYRYWKSNLPCKWKEDEMSVVLTMVGQDRNLPCAHACHYFINKFDVGTFVLIGMGAGVKEKVKLGDVVVGETVYDYEGARLEKTGSVKRPIPYKINSQLSRSLEYYDPFQSKWKENFMARFEELKSITDVPELGNWTPSFLKKIILCGEKLVADGSIGQWRFEIHEGSRVLEMESSGFASTCEECDKHWLVFRGISDYGDPETKDKRDPTTQSRKIWQATASLVAATISIDFLMNDYKPPSQDDPF